MKKFFIFLFCNAIIISILCLPTSLGMIHIDNNFSKFIALFSHFLALILEFGGEFIISAIFSYRTKFKINFKVLLFSIILNVVIIKLLVFDLYMSTSFITIFCINQILGLLFGELLKKIKKKV